MVSVFEVQAELTSSGVTEEILENVLSIGVLQPKHYLEIVEERVVMGKCGYPVCKNVLIERGGVRVSALVPKFTEDDGQQYCHQICADKSRLLLGRVERSVHFSAPKNASSSVDDVLRAMAVASDEHPLTRRPPPSLSASPIKETQQEVDLTDDGLPSIAPPVTSHPALSSSGRVNTVDVEADDTTQLPSNSIGGSGTVKTAPKRIRQLKRAIIEESAQQPQQPQARQQEEMLGGLSARFAPLSLHNPSTTNALPASSSSVFTGGAQITFAALNFTPSSSSHSSFAPKPKKSTQIKDAGVLVSGEMRPRDDNMQAARSTKTITNAVLTAGSNASQQKRRGPKVVSWSEEVLAGDASRTQQSGSSKSAARGIPPLKQVQPTPAVRRGVLVGHVLERDVTEQHALQVQQQQQWDAVNTPGLGAGWGANTSDTSSKHTAIEGYVSTLQKLPSAALRGSVPRMEEVHGGETDEDNMSLQDDDQHEHEHDYEEDEGEEGEEEDVDSGSNRSEDGDYGDDYDTPLNVFSALWLATDDIFANMLPLNTNSTISGGDQEDRATKEVNHAQLSALYPELCRGIAYVESELGVSSLPQSTLAPYQFDLAFIEGYLVQQQRLPTLSSLTASEWNILALLLVDGILRYRGCTDKDKSVLSLLTRLVQSCPPREPTQPPCELSDREVFHLRCSFCSL